MTLSQETIERDLEFAVDAAREAGRRALELRGLERWEGKMLADIGDQAADGFLQGYVRGRYSDDGILSEETADSPARLECKRTWIIDPLDGTREFSQMRHDWAVHVALTYDHECALAAVALPSKGTVIWGVCMNGAERAGIDGDVDLVHGTSPSPEPARIAVSRSHTPEWVDAFGEQLGGKELVRAGSAGYKVSLLLTGQADIYVHKKGLKEWDTCAPETVARALGWTVCKLRGEEHRYNQANPRNHELVVCRPEWKDRVVAGLARAGALTP